MSDKERAVQSTLNQIWNRLYNGELKDPTIKWTDSPYRDLLNALFDAGWAARSEASAWVSVAELVDAVEAVLLVVDRKTDAVDRLKTAVANVKSRTDVGIDKLSRQLEIAMQCVSECEQRSGCQNHSKIKEMS